MIKANVVQDEVCKGCQLKVEADKKLMQKEFDKGRGGGKWPIWVAQYIYELLVNGMPPSAIPLNLETLYKTLHGFEPKHKPSISYVCHCRTLIQIVGKTVTDIQLTGNPNLKQI